MKILIFTSMLLLASLAEADTARLSALASELIDSLEAGQREALLHPLKHDKRATWSNLPVIMAPPVGVLMAELDSGQQKLVRAMLHTSLSSQGFLKANAIMWLDDFLREQEKAALDPESERYSLQRTMYLTRSSGNYAVAIFGDPRDAAWGWKITGHHLGINITVAQGKIGAFPMHFGSNPRVVPDGPYAGYAVLAKESSLALDFMRSLDAQQHKASGAPGERPRDFIEGPGRRGSLQKFEGLPASELNQDQLAALQMLVGEHVRTAPYLSAAEFLDVIAASGWSKLWFSWRGEVCENCEFYYRVHGPRLLIEYHRQNPNHDHIVVRDPLNDYGEDWLDHHYKEVHPSMDEAFANLRRAAGVDASE